MSGQARRAAVQKHLNQVHEGETLQDADKRAEEQPGCDPANVGGLNRNHEVPSRSEGGAPDMCEMFRDTHHDATNTLSRKCPRHPDTTLPNTLVEGTAKQRQCKPTDACEGLEEAGGRDG